MKIVVAIFEKMKIKNFFLCELPLILEVGRKRKNELNIFTGDPRYRMWMRLASWFRRYVRRRTENKKTIFLVSGIFFSGKTESIRLLRFECAINPQNLMKIVGAIFEKIKILHFFLCELPLILRVGRKRKKWAKDICKGTLDIECERDWPVG